MVYSVLARVTIGYKTTEGKQAHGGTSAHSCGIAFSSVTEELGQSGALSKQTPFVSLVLM